MWVAFATTCVLFGHVALSVAIYNRLHATALRPRVLKVVELPFAAWFLAGPILAWWNWDAIVARNPAPLARLSLLACAGGVYVLFATAAGVAVLARWVHSCLRPLPPLVRSVQCASVAGARESVWRAHRQRLEQQPHVTERDGLRVAQGLLNVPGNESLDLSLTHTVLTYPRLPEALDGLRIAHLSDLHFTGRVPREFFELAIERTNRWQPDMIAVTGDFVDDWRCRAWLPETLGRLQSSSGICFLLGNHDRWSGHAGELRRELERLGLIDVGNRVRTFSVRGVSILIAGNEEPWFQPAPDGVALARATTDESVEFRLLLSHSPDQVSYARAHGFDLMLAGHTHGGQIRFPLIGPVIAPSRYGVRFASGVFQRGTTVLGVTRGLSGEEPIRWNCPPEACLWELRRGGHRDC